MIRIFLIRHWAKKCISHNKYVKVYRITLNPFLVAAINLDDFLEHQVSKTLDTPTLIKKILIF